MPYAIRVRILFTRFPLESAYGGAEVQTLSLMRGLIERGHTVNFLGSCPVLLAQCKEAGIPARSLDIGLPPVTEWLAGSFLWRQWGMQRQLADALENDSKPDAIVMLSMSEKLLLTAYADRLGMRVFWLEHDRIGRWLKWNPWLPLLLRASKLATTVCVSELSRRIYVEIGWPAARTIAIPNGIDLRRFAHREWNASAAGMLRTGCVARLTRDKGVDLLLRAIAGLPKVTLTIVGDGPERGQLDALIAVLGIGDRVKIERRLPELGAFYQSVDCVVLPSREHDPFGLAAAEAMALGTPVIVTDACGIALHLKEGEALVAEANSVSALQKAIQDMQDPPVRAAIGSTGERAARERFALPRMIEEYEQLLLGFSPIHGLSFRGGGARHGG